MIPYARPKIFKNDIAKVNTVLNSQFLTTGPEIPKFENKLKKKLNSKYALTVNSATSALHLCCLAMGLSKMTIFGPQALLLLQVQIVVFTVEQKLI